MKNLLLVEDHPVFARTLVQILKQQEDLNVVMVADTAEKALELIPDLDLDLILVDVSLPKMNGIDLVGELTQMYPHILCLVVSGHLSDVYVRRSLAAGARGYVTKDSANGIIEGIYQVLQGEIYIGKELRSP